MAFNSNDTENESSAILKAAKVKGVRKIIKPLVYLRNGKNAQAMASRDCLCRN